MNCFEPSGVAVELLEDRCRLSQGHIARRLSVLTERFDFAPYETVWRTLAAATGQLCTTLHGATPILRRTTYEPAGCWRPSPRSRSHASGPLPTDGPTSAGLAYSFP